MKGCHFLREHKARPVDDLQLLTVVMSVLMSSYMKYFYINAFNLNCFAANGIHTSNLSR